MPQKPICLSQGVSKIQASSLFYRFFGARDIIFKMEWKTIQCDRFMDFGGIRVADLHELFSFEDCCILQYDIIGVIGRTFLLSFDT
jgi:hypothetical protein